MKNSIGSSSNISTTSPVSNLSDITLTTGFELLNTLAQISKFQPSVFYSTDKDTIEVYFKSGTAISNKLTNDIDLYRDSTNDEIIGIGIHNIQKLLDTKALP